MRINLSNRAKDSYQKLPMEIQKKADKQFILLATNPRYPSLRTKKMSGLTRFEARIDRSYRLTFTMSGEEINILSVGPHDTGLGKK